MQRAAPGEGEQPFETWIDGEENPGRRMGQLIKYVRSGYYLFTSFLRHGEIEINMWINKIIVIIACHRCRPFSVDL